MKRAAIVLTLSALVTQLSCTLPSGMSTIELRGGWEFRRLPDGAWRKAVVPGCVHTDLLANGLIPDPFYGTNEKDLQWIENEDWEYRTTFDVDREFRAKERVELDFKGLDTYAEIFLNDSLLIRTDNMFREWRAGCTGLLREHGNVLRVRFYSPVKRVEGAWRSLGHELPGGPRVLTRKAAYQYGWDWGPRYVTSGIWLPVYLRGWDRARIADLHVVQESVTDREARCAARFEIESISEQSVTLSIYCDNKRRGSVDAGLHPGRNTVTIEFSIPDPRLWWTNGLGRPNLYHVLGEMRTGGETVDWAERRIGIRTIELVHEPDRTGKSFFFRLNGVPVFMKGANYIPQDSFLPRVSGERYDALIGSAAAAGMNMLRVWGGGVYEDDVFYDLCDENGILVWQDFMFACAMYPGDDAFLANVEEEAVENVTRLRDHPCIALWCGNNEIDEAWHHWGWQRAYGYSAADSAAIWADYEKLFGRLLPSVVERLDPGAPYWPSSPSFGRAEARSLSEGDSHYWGVWHDAEPFEVLAEKVPRFMSEFGFQSYPSLGSIQRFARRDEWSVDSDAMRAHEKHPRGNELIRTYMARSYRVPADFKSFVYVSEVLQAEGIRLGIEAQRRAKPYCMGTLFWQLNDCWPAVSWSSIDYFGAPKALYYFARKAFGEVLVSPVLENGVVRVYAVSDRMEPVEALAVLKIVDFTGATVWMDERLVNVRENSSRCIFEADAEKLLHGRARGEVLFSAELSEGKELLSRNLLYFAPPKELDLPRAETGAPPEEEEREREGARSKPAPLVSIASISEDDDGYAITLCARSLVKNLCLAVEGHGGVFDDNYFDMLPGSCVTVHFVTDERIRNLSKSLRMMSLADTY